jgi:S1-C subfamily serine protease
MNRNRTLILSLILMVALVTSACGIGAAIQESANNSLESQLEELLPEVQNQVEQAVEEVQPEKPAPQAEPVAPLDPGLLAAYESTLTNIYNRVNPSVVNIRVVSQGGALQDLGELPDMPFFNMPDFPGMPEVPDQDLPLQQGLGSGFVWDQQGHIITNNHVIEGASKVEVTFDDGTVAVAEVTGADPDSDLAVLKVDLPEERLQPVEFADSDQLTPGQLAIAIGNPFGLEGTMTVGIISALGRSLPASELGLVAGPVYNIPNLIQTDAPINPGNSGGVLLNDQGQVIGVTFAIESPVRANAGIGFAIPSSVVQKVVPALIEAGAYQHPYLGISGISLTPDFAEAMDLDGNQRGALVVEVTEGGPAEEAGLRGSDQPVTVDGQEFQVGGDVIVSVDGEPINSMDDLIAYLSAQTEVGQEVTLGILRDGQKDEVDVTLAARPTRVEEPNTAEPQQPAPSENRAYLGILGQALLPEISAAMDLPEDQQGVLVVEVQPDSPAQEAGLQGSTETTTINGQEVRIGGDVITALDGEPVASVDELSALIQQAGAGEKVTLSILRDGDSMEVEATLAEQTQ